MVVVNSFFRIAAGFVIVWRNLFFLLHSSRPGARWNPSRRSAGHLGWVKILGFCRYFLFWNWNIIYIYYSFNYSTFSKEISCKKYNIYYKSKFLGAQTTFKSKTQLIGQLSCKKRWALHTKDAYLPISQVDCIIIRQALIFQMGGDQ